MIYLKENKPTVFLFHSMKYFYFPLSQLTVKNFTSLLAYALKNAALAACIPSIFA